MVPHTWWNITRGLEFPMLGLTPSLALAGV